MLVFDFNKTNYGNLMKLIKNGKKIFLLCYTHDKTSMESVNEWFMLQVFKKYIPSNDVVLAQILVDSNVNVLRLFPRIHKTGKELPRVVFIDGMNSVTKYNGQHYTKYFIEWIKYTLENINQTIYDHTLTNDNDSAIDNESTVGNEIETYADSEHTDSVDDDDKTVIDISC
jgi:hypothetical protein